MTLLDFYSEAKEPSAQQRGEFLLALQQPEAFFLKGEIVLLSLGEDKAHLEVRDELVWVDILRGNEHFRFFATKEELNTLGDYLRQHPQLRKPSMSDIL